MRKAGLLLVFWGLLFNTSSSFAGDIFDSLDGLSQAQKGQIANIQNSFKIKNDEFEARISGYIDKIAKLRYDKEKTEAQIALLKSAYERNIITIKNQQQILLNENESLFRTILSDKQYKQYKVLQASL